MKEQAVQLCPRQRQIVELLLQGCDNAEIARQLNIALRTVKYDLNRLFLRFGITGGTKRVKLATLIYRTQVCQDVDSMAIVSPGREHRVIELVAEGFRNKEVGDAIGKSENMVKNYLRVIYDKLGLWNRVELALWYESHRRQSVALTQ
jgi:DNA-binding NarL/FixJ family response regulator